MNPRTKRLSPVRPAGKFVLAWLPVIALVLLIRTTMVEAFMVPTPSMVPTILVGDFLLVDKVSCGLHVPFSNRELLPVGRPRCGDLVVFRCPAEPNWPQPEANYIRCFPKWLPLFPLYWCRQDNPAFNGHRRGFVTYTPKTFVKRCVVVAGDTVAIRDKRLFINGRPAPDSTAVFVRPEVIPAAPRRQTAGDLDPVCQQRWESGDFGQKMSVRDNFGPVVVPAGCIMAMGDNRDNSWDSHFWGPLPLHDVRGRLLVLYLSYGSPVPAGHTEYDYDVHSVNIHDVLRRPLNVRLRRNGHLRS